MSKHLTLHWVGEYVKVFWHKVILYLFPFICSTLYFQGCLVLYADRRRETTSLPSYAKGWEKIWISHKRNLSWSLSVSFSQRSCNFISFESLTDDVNDMKDALPGLCKQFYSVYVSMKLSVKKVSLYPVAESYSLWPNGSPITTMLASAKNWWPTMLCGIVADSSDNMGSQISTDTRH